MEVGGKRESSGELYSPALYLKEYLSTEIKRMLTASLKHRHAKNPELKQKLLPGGVTKPEDVEVKDIQFAYKNHEVIDILKKRGAAIAATKW